MPEGWSRRARLSAISTLFILVSLPALAVNYRWDGEAADNDWQNQVNWYNITSTTNDSGFPGAGDDVQFDQALSPSLINIPAVTFNSITVNTAHIGATSGVHLSSINADDFVYVV